MTHVLIFLTVILCLTTIGGAAAYYYSNEQIDKNTFVRSNLILIGSENPTLWLYYDQSEVNSRWWADFGGRSSRVLNAPFLNLCYESIVMNNGTTYNVKVLAGLSDVAVLLGGWKELPTFLQNPIAPVGEAEINYIRSTILRRFGGLWVKPSTIFLQSLPDLSEQENVVFFGTDKDETYSDSKGTSVPGTDIMYSPYKDHPIFVVLEELSLKRIEHQEGGKQFRKDIKWDLYSVMNDFSDMISYYPEFEFARKSNGKRIQLEDLLSSNDIIISTNALYVPLDWEELQNRSNFSWFLRMSEEQILESNLFISILFKFNNIISR